MLRHPHRFVLAAALVATLAPQSLADTPLLEFPPMSNNAALQYWQAFATLPALDEAQEKLLDDRATVPLDATARKLLDDAHASFFFLSRASKLHECDWGLDYRDGISMRLPHLIKARALARLAALETRRAFEEGQHDRAGEMAFGMTAMARQVGGDHTLVSMLVCYAIEGIMVDAVAPYLPDLKASYANSLSLFESLPPSPQLQHGVQCEKRLAYTIVTQLKEQEQKQPGSWRETWKAMLGPDVADPLKEVQSFDELIALIDNFQTTYDELSQLAAMPWRDFDARYPDFEKRAEAASPVAKILLPAMQKVTAAQRQADARVALLLASIAVVEGGPDKLAGIKDPYGDGPFEYRKLDGNAFELSSKLQHEGKPVTLVVGKKPTAAKP